MLPLTGDYISFTWNTDGVPVFQSSQYSIWPLLLQVNELLYHESTQNQILAGLWFGPERPNMSSFLKPFVESERPVNRWLQLDVKIWQGKMLPSFPRSLQRGQRSKMPTTKYDAV